MTSIYDVAKEREKLVRHDVNEPCLCIWTAVP